MKTILMLPILLGAAAVASFIGLSLTSEDYQTDDILSLQPTEEMQDSKAAPIPTAVFTYYDTETVSESLSARGLQLSIPVPITDHTISQYCSYYNEEKEKFETVSYCTTSGISNSVGITVGNFNLGGDITNPTMAITVLDPVASGITGQIQTAAIISGVIEGLVCDCWAEENPGGFASVLEWVDATETMLVGNSDRTSLKSTISGLADGVTVTLEATAISNGYQWSLVILQNQ